MNRDGASNVWVQCICSCRNFNEAGLLCFGWTLRIYSALATRRVVAHLGQLAPNLLLLPHGAVGVLLSLSTMKKNSMNLTLEVSSLLCHDAAVWLGAHIPLFSACPGLGTVTHSDQRIGCAPGSIPGVGRAVRQRAAAPPLAARRRPVSVWRAAVTVWLWQSAGGGNS
jgi:hypothetical protein